MTRTEAHRLVKRAKLKPFLLQVLPIQILGAYRNIGLISF